jgi:hypothetical protein
MKLISLFYFILSTVLFTFILSVYKLKEKRNPMNFKKKFNTVMFNNK